MHEAEDGILFDDGSLKVSAFHNEHIIDKSKREWISYSFLIEAENKKIVYSGDLKAYSELDALIGEHCDALIIETGHFGIDDVHEYLKNKSVDRVFFSHNGREILNFQKESKEKVELYFEGRGSICEDKMTVEL